MTPDPMLQAILALCAHAGFVADCEACEARRLAAFTHLGVLADAAMRRAFDR